MAIKNYLTTALDGKQYDVVFYSLKMILAVGSRVLGVRGTQFRKWTGVRIVPCGIERKIKRQSAFLLTGVLLYI